MLALIAATIIPLVPPYPTPTPAPSPGYLVQGDGTRLLCTPTGSYCWPSNDGLPNTITSP